MPTEIQTINHSRLPGFEIQIIPESGNEDQSMLNAEADLLGKLPELLAALQSLEVKDPRKENSSSLRPDEFSVELALGVKFDGSLVIVNAEANAALKVRATWKTT
jgi:hypothetical protein